MDAGRPATRGARIGGGAPASASWELKTGMPWTTSVYESKPGLSHRNARSACGSEEYDIVCTPLIMALPYG